MTIAATLRDFLDEKGVEYELIEHDFTNSSMQTAQAAHIPGDQLAKSVMLEDDEGYLLAVLPCTHRVQLGSLHHQMNRRLGLATEEELAELFGDCALGAVPALGQAYGVDVLVDYSLSGYTDIFFEAGDHTDLVHIMGKDFESLMADAKHGQFSRHL